MVEYLLEVEKNRMNRPMHRIDSISLPFPALFPMGHTLVPAERRSFRKMLYRGSSGTEILIASGALPKLQISWLVTSDARFWRLERVGTQRAYWRWLAPVVDFTLAECRLVPGRHLTTDELLTHIEPLKSPPGFPTAGHLKGFLRKRLGQVFDETMFKEFWQKHCFELKPPDSWGEVLEF